MFHDKRNGITNLTIIIELPRNFIIAAMNFAPKIAETTKAHHRIYHMTSTT